MRQVVILGGGISGLSLAFFIRNAWRRLPTHKQPLKISIVDSSSNLGGWIRSERTRPGYLFEYGPRGFRPSRNGAEVLRLIEELNLQDQMLTVSPKAASSRYILRNKRVEKVPTSLMEFMRWPLAMPVCKSLFNEVLTPQKRLRDESIYDFISRRFDSVVAERLIDPMASGIFGGDIRKLSIRSCFPILYDLEKKHGSILRGMAMNSMKRRDKIEHLLDGTEKSEFIRQYERSVSISFREGMGALVQALRVELESSSECRVLCNTRAIRLGKHLKNGSDIPSLCVTVRKNNGEQDILHATDVYSTIPAKDLMPIVRDASSNLANTLSSIQYSSIGMIHLGYTKNVLNSGGFGYLVPTLEKENVLGVVYDSCAFPDQNVSGTPQTRLSVMCGGAHHPEIASYTSEQLESLAISAVSRHLCITEKCAYINSVVLKDCIPQYHVGLYDTCKEAERHAAAIHNHFHLAGNSLYGIGLADCIHHSRKLALQFFDQPSVKT